MESRFVSLLFLIYTSQMSSIVESTPCEDEFVKHFGNLPNMSYISWEKVFKWNREDNRMELYQICNDAYGLRVNGSYFIEKVIFIEAMKLVFQNPSYNPIQIDVLTFQARKDERYLPAHIKDYEKEIQYKTWYLTQGLRSDCVHFLTLRENQIACQLLDHVCGLTWS